MKIVPSGSAQTIQQAKPANKVAAAIAAFERGSSSYDKPAPAPASQPQAQEHPVANPNQVSAEELSALNIPKPNIQEQTETQTSKAEETPNAPQTDKDTQDPRLSKQFAQLARQAKLLRQQQQALKQQEIEIKAKEQALKSVQPPQVDLSKYISKDEFLSNPLKVMAETGLSYDTLTQQLLNTTPTDPRTEAVIKKQEERIAQLEAKIDEASKKQVEAQDEVYRAAVKQIEIDARNLIKNDPNYETIRSTGSLRDVVELITETHKKDGYVMTVEEAANEVENYLVEEAMKLTNIGKIKQRLAQSAQTKPVQKTEAKPQTQPGMKTLTNAHGTSRQLSGRERAILAFNNKL
jgi:hypothetical protein